MLFRVRGLSGRLGQCENILAAGALNRVSGESSRLRVSSHRVNPRASSPGGCENTGVEGMFLKVLAANFLLG